VVAVVRGKVGVSSGGAETLLLPGDHWSSEPRIETAAKPAEPAVATATPEARTSVAKNPTKQPPKRPAVASIDPGALGAENQLFASALAASHRGDDRNAVAFLDQLLAHHPESPLVPEARVERFRALKRLGDDAAAAREARRYLLEQHDGAARDEARDVALGAK
jgi:hypothetical protein